MRGLSGLSRLSRLSRLSGLNRLRLRLSRLSSGGGRSGSRGGRGVTVNRFLRSVCKSGNVLLLLHNHGNRLADIDVLRAFGHQDLSHISLTLIDKKRAHFLLGSEIQSTLIRGNLRMSNITKNPYLSKNVSGLDSVALLHIPRRNSTLGHRLLLTRHSQSRTGDNAGMETVICSGNADAKKRASCIE